MYFVGCTYLCLFHLRRTAYHTLLSTPHFYTRTQPSVCKHSSRASQDSVQSSLPDARLSAALASRPHSAMCKAPPLLALLDLEEWAHLLGTRQKIGLGSERETRPPRLVSSRPEPWTLRPTSQDRLSGHGSGPPPQQGFHLPGLVPPSFNK